jgi:hypothetical protein
MLGVHINPMLDFREHFTYSTKYGKIIAKALPTRKLSSSLKTHVVEQLLKSKYHLTHLGGFNERQFITFDGILNKAIRQALGLLPNLHMEEVQIPLKEVGMGLPSMRDRAT